MNVVRELANGWLDAFKNTSCIASQMISPEDLNLESWIAIIADSSRSGIFEHF